MKLDPRLTRLIGWVRVHQTWLTVVMMAVVLGVAGLALMEILKEVRVEDIRAGVQAAVSLAGDPDRNAWVQRALGFAQAHRGAATLIAQQVLRHASPAPPP